MLTAHDLENFGAIISQGYGDWFTAHLIRLIKKADPANRNRLRRGFPFEVHAVERWETVTRPEWVRFVETFEEKENTNGHSG